MGLFEDAGYSLPSGAGSDSANGGAASAPSTTAGALFRDAGFSVPTIAAKPAPGADTLSQMKAKAAEEGVNLPTPGEKETVEPVKSTARKVIDAINEFNPVDLLSRGGEHAIHDAIENAAAGWAQAKQGWSEIRSGQGAPRYVGPGPVGHDTNVFGETHEVPGLPQYAPGGYLRAASGLAGIVGAPVTGATNALVTRPITEITGNPDIGDRAGFLASVLLPMKGVPKAVEAVAPETKSVNTLVKAIGPENVPEAVARLRENPRLSIADVSDTARTLVQGMTEPGQPSVQNLVSAKVNERRATLPSAVNSAYTEAMGPAPDVVTMLEGLRQRTAAAGTDTANARAALDRVLGPSVDPYQELQTMLSQRSKSAQPLYEKALNRPIAWDDRLQQFLDDPIVQSGIAKGVRIQRLESLAENKVFNPNDYAIKSFNEAGDPVIGPTPNMRTLNVVKKGLDSMVESATDPVTGKLSEEGRAVDKVRRAFLEKLDDINPDYKAARQAWAGPSQAHEAFNRGLNLFQNKAGSSGVNSTPEAFGAWLKNASEADRDAARIGARSAFEQQMRMASDPAASAAATVNKEANQAKLTALFGKDAADHLIQQLNFTFEDPVGKAFNEGFDVLKNRSGVQGLQDRPEVLQNWMKTAAPEEVVAKRLGVRADIDQKIRGVKNQALAGQTITNIEYNQDKLRTLFGDKEAGRLIRVMKDAQDEARTNAKLVEGSKTAETIAGRNALAIRKVEGGNPLQYAVPFMSEFLGSQYGIPGVGAAMLGLKGAHFGAQKVGQWMDLARNYNFARNALATGPDRESTINALLSHPKVVRELKKRANALTSPVGNP